MKEASIYPVSLRCHGEGQVLHTGERGSLQCDFISYTGKLGEGGGCHGSQLCMQ